MVEGDRKFFLAMSFYLCLHQCGLQIIEHSSWVQIACTLRRQAIKCDGGLAGTMDYEDAWWAKAV